MSYSPDDATILRQAAEREHNDSLEESEQLVKQIKLALDMAIHRLENERREARMVYNRRLDVIAETFPVNQKSGG